MGLGTGGTRWRRCDLKLLIPLLANILAGVVLGLISLKVRPLVHVTIIAHGSELAGGRLVGSLQ